MVSELKHRLYERAVQSPEHDLRFLERAYATHVGGFPLRLREDFCGTAQLASRWVESDDERSATGVDRDPEVLRHAGHELDGEELERLELLRGDVTLRTEHAFDVVVAMNFSWAILDERALAAYLSCARAHTEGILVLELFGGEGLRAPSRVAHRLDGFTYVWEQRCFDGERLDAAIHFALDDGRRLDDAFLYSFLLRPTDRLREMLADAGFDEVALYVEDERGRYARRPRSRKPLWRAYLVAR